MRSKQSGTLRLYLRVRRHADTLSFCGSEDYPLPIERLRLI